MSQATRPAPTGPPAPSELVHTFRAMATDVTCQVVRPTEQARAALDRAQDVFRRVEVACTRFDPASPLMRANAAPRRWHQVPVELFEAVREAAAAHRETGGLFDPRVLGVLRGWGYDRSLPFHDGPVHLSPRAGNGDAATPAGWWARRAGTPGRRAWRPRFDPAGTAIRIGTHPIDLGGIGKGLAVRWAAEQLAGAGDSVLVEAGGDVYGGGAGPDGTGWRVAVEDPRGGTDPVAVLGITDAGCATSSVRIRRWLVDGKPVHHLVDPRTGTAGGAGLLAVTVVDPDPAHAEVWSKALFLTGRGGLRALADERGIAALLVDTDGVVGVSRAMRPYLVWQAPHVW